MSFTPSLPELSLRLQRSVYVQTTEDGTPLPVISDHHTEGVVVPVYGDRAAASRRLEELSSRYGRPARLQEMAPLWDTMRRFAQLGFAGMMLDEQHPVHFLNR